MQIIKKNAQGYGYNYTDLAEITKLLDENGISYYQYIEPLDGVDYIMTVIEVDGEPPRTVRGCRVIDAKLPGESNPVQEYGAALTYCRRYSLLMAFGLATADDDAYICGEYVTAKEIRILEATCKAKGVRIEELFNCDYKKLTPQQYAKAMDYLKTLGAGK